MTAKELDYIIMPIDFCEPNDVLGQDVLTSGGKLVLSKGTILTKEFIEKLKAMDIFTIKIELNQDAEHHDDDVYVNDSHKETVEKAYAAMEVIMKSIGERKAAPIKKYEKELVDLLEVTVATGEVLDILRQVQVFDDYIYKHSLATGIYASMLGMWLGYKGKDLQNIGLAGLLHDIGMTKISHDIINKSGALTEAEMNVVKKHVKYGRDIVELAGFQDQGLLSAIYQHHERSNGSGYPIGLRAADIHPYANIVAVADCYHAMTTDRPYKKKKTHIQALSELWQEAFVSLDPRAVLVFIKGMMGRYRGRLLRMTDGQAGKLVFVHNDDPTNPIIRLGKGDDAKYIDMRYEKGIQIEEIL